MIFDLGETERSATFHAHDVYVMLKAALERILFSVGLNLQVEIENGRLNRVFALRPIKAGEELNISYVDTSWSRVERQQHLRRFHLFWCSCERCTIEEKEGIYPLPESSGAPPTHEKTGDAIEISEAHEDPGYNDHE